jgi:hypothetical protein
MKERRRAQMTHTGGASQKRDRSGAERNKKASVPQYPQGVRRVAHLIVQCSMLQLIGNQRLAMTSRIQHAVVAVGLC